MKLLIATTNHGKIIELADLLKELPCEILTPADLGLSLEVTESGTTYVENAALKAEAFHRASGLTTLADDTGIEVDALDGRPGVYSARYGEHPGATDADRRARLLGELAAFPAPWTAHFHCTVAIAGISEQTLFFHGDLYGEVIAEESGEYGFGYDRIFYVPEMKKTLAACNIEEKNRISHRALAVKAALSELLSHCR
jgi:XTP/dITP diphosphohydrolase